MFRCVEKRTSKCRPSRSSLLFHPLRLEQLESRQLLAASATFTGGHLEIFGDNANNDITITFAVNSGNKYVHVTDGMSVIFDGVAENVLTSDVTQITAEGGVGNDRIDASNVIAPNGFTGLDENIGDVTLLGNADSDTLVGSEYNDALSGGDGNDSLTGGNGGDWLNGGGGNDTLSGQGGNDVYNFVRLASEVLGTDTLIEGTGGSNDTIDTLYFAGFNVAVVVDLGNTSNQSFASGDLVINLNANDAFEGVAGTSFSDSITGNARDNWFVGSAGNDTLVGGAGNDMFAGEAGDDSLVGGAGDDLYSFEGTGLGSDTITEAANADSDLLLFQDFGDTVTLDLSSTATQTVNTGDLSLTLSDSTAIEWVIGSAFNDSLTGNSRDNLFRGGVGNDTLVGGAGDDWYQFEGTGLGSDTITEAADSDRDILDFAGLGDTYVINLGSTSAQASASSEVTITLSNATGIEGVVGTAGNDTITGNSRANMLYGAGGNDVISGGVGRDLIWGGDGADNLSGGDDDDILISGEIILPEMLPDALACINTIMDEWESANNFATRIDNIKNNIAVDCRLIPKTIVIDDDDDVDTLDGGPGDDWVMYDFGEDTTSNIEQSDDIGP